MNETDFVCNECNIKHSYITKDGLIDTIAHVVYHIRREFGIDGSESDKLYAERVFRWFEDKYVKDAEGDEWYKRKKEEYERFYPYYRAYHLERLRK